MIMFGMIKLTHIKAMDLNNVVRQIKKGIDSLNFEKALKHSSDEAKTREYLINPFFEHVLNYDKIDDFLPEYYADMVGKKRKKVDMAINLGMSNPIIFVECKKANGIQESNVQQLFNYCLPTKSVKFGILTDGIEYSFYSYKAIQEAYPIPFFKFNLEDYKTSDLETLALFYMQYFNPNKANEIADDFYFNDKFEKALYKVHSSNDVDFAKLISAHMGYSRANDSLKSKILQSINSISLSNVVDKIVKNEIHGNNSGIITTNDEMKFFSIVKTILAMSSKNLNNHIDRVQFKDHKNLFNIIIDGKSNKIVCSLKVLKTSQQVIIGSEKFNISNISSDEITKLKKPLIDSAKRHLELV